MGFLDDPRAREASRLAFLADRMRSGGDEADARRHFARAAVLETELLAALPLAEQALFSMLAVSAAALWFKARDPRELDELAKRLLDNNALTPDARAEIAEMHAEALQDERDRARRRVVLTTFELEGNFRLLIEAALREGGSIARAAAILGLSRHALRRRLDKYGIEQPDEEKKATTDPVGRRGGDTRDA